MALGTCKVYTYVYKQDGTPDTDARISARLSRWEVVDDEGYVGPFEVEALADSDGYVEIELVPNQVGSTESVYKIRIEGSERTLNTTCVVPDLPIIALENIAVLPPYEGKNDGDLLIEQAEQIIQDAIQPAADAAAQAATELAEDYRDETLGYRNETEGFRNEAESFRDEAEATLTTTTPLPPPVAGTATNAEWVDPNTGRRYTLIDDGDSRQWVETGAAIALSDANNQIAVDAAFAAEGYKDDAEDAADRAEVAAGQAQAIAVGDFIDDVTPSAGMVYSSQHVALALAEKVNTLDLADATDPDKGASGVGYRGRTQAEKNADFKTDKDYPDMASAITDVLVTNSTLTVTQSAVINIPTDCPTLQDAVDHIVPSRPEISITLRIESNHNPASGVYVKDGDYSSFTISSEDAVVVVDPSFPHNSSFVFGENARMPTLGALIDMNQRGNHGYYARKDSQGVVLPGCGITNLGTTGPAGIESAGLFANAGSVFYASGARSFNNSRNVWVSRGSQFEGENGDYSGATGDHAIYVSRNSTIHISACDITNSAGNAVMLRRSRATLDSSDLSGAAGTGLFLERTSQASMTIRDSVRPLIAGCGVDGVVVQQGSSFHFDGGDITNNGRDGVSVSQSSSCTISNSNVEDNVRYGAANRQASGLSLLSCRVVGNGTDVFRADGGLTTLASTETSEGVLTETSIGPVRLAGVTSANGFLTLTAGSLGYGRFVVSADGANPGGTEYDPTAKELRILTDGVRRLRVLANGTLRPETDDTYDLGATDRRFANVRSKNFRPGTGAATWSSGTGSPEGVITANPGSLYTRTDGGAGSTLYIKESGNGNTGWVAK